MNQRALFLVNRRSRRGKDNLSQAVSHLQMLGFELLEESTSEPQHLPDIICRYRDRIDLVIIGGGDGTLNAAVEGLVETQLPLGILPLGTANDLARTLGIPPTIPEACQIIATGQIQRIDLGWVNGKHFFNVASMGLSVQIAKQLTKEVKRRWGVFAYAATALRALGQTRPFWAEIRQGNESIQVKTIQIAVGNGRFYGGGMAVADDATINDQRLDLYSLEIQHWWEMLFLLPAIRQGQQAQWPSVRTLRGQEFEVTTHKPLAINTDGEIVTRTPAQFRLIPQVIPVLVPRERSIPGLG